MLSFSDGEYLSDCGVQDHDLECFSVFDPRQAKPGFDGSEATMLLTSSQVVPRSGPDRDSALLRCKVEELNNNTVRLIGEAEKLIEESKQLSERIKSFRAKERTTLGAAAHSRVTD
jgi:hypothetical protein